MIDLELGFCGVVKNKKRFCYLKLCFSYKLFRQLQG